MKNPVYILGISALYHDSAACLVRDGEIVAAAQEERFTRKKHDDALPVHAANYCLQEAGITIDRLDCVAFYEKPFLKFERLLLTYLSCAPKGLKNFAKAMPVWLKEKIFTKELIAHGLKFHGPIIFPEHHESHAASAFFPSPFKDAAILTLDGVGEWTTTSIGAGHGNQIELIREIQFPHSLGLLYSAFTYYAGFRVNSGEYKLMGLAPYGEAKYVDLIKKELIDIKPDGSFRLNLKYFDYPVGLTMTNGHFNRLFGAEPRQPDSPITQKHMDIARSIQEVTEEVMLGIARHAHQLTGEKNLCLAGGVALNCVGNGRILREGPFDNIWIQPASGDAGGALGAALLAWHQHLGNPRCADNLRDSQRASLLGPSPDKDIQKIADDKGWVYERLSDESLPLRIADLLEQGKVIGLCHGRMEFGPRALGNRSIIADARSETMQSILNLKVKFRESFRPFAPSILQEKVSDYFDMDGESPYMLLVAPVRENKRVPECSRTLNGIEKLKARRSIVPAVTHVDYSARVQTVRATDNPLYYSILKAFESKTDCPVVINTSFNIRGEPIVNSAQDAYRCFMCTEMDFLLINNLLFERAKQPDLGKFKKENISTIPD